METLFNKFGTPDELPIIRNRRNSAELAFTSALYNSIAIAFLIVGVLLCCLLLIVLQAFVRSILWALLTGAFLFAFKRYFTVITREKLKLIDDNGSSLSLQLFMLPIKLLDSASEYVFDMCLKRYRQLAVLIGAVVAINILAIFYEHIVEFICIVFKFFFRVTDAFAYFVDNFWPIACTILIGYLVAIAIYWNDDYKPLFKILSLPIWTCFLFMISAKLGWFRRYFLMGLFVLIFLGIFQYFKELIIKHKEKLMKVKANILGDESLKGDSDDDNESITDKSKSEEDDVTQNDENQATNAEEAIRPDTLNLNNDVADKPKETDQNTEMNKSRNPKLEKSKLGGARVLERTISNAFSYSKSKSDKYFYLLFWLFVSLKIWSISFLLIALFILTWKFIKFILIKTVNFLYNHFEIERMLNKVKNSIYERKEVLAPRPLKVIFNFYIKGDKKINEWLQTSLDTIISAFIIFALLVFLISGLVLLAMQVHSESIELITTTTNIINENLYSQPQLRQLLPEKEKVNELLQTAINNFYLYGREWLSERLKYFISSSSEQHAIESKLLAQWDFFYTFLSQKASNITNNTYEANLTSQTDNGSTIIRQRSIDFKNTWQLINTDNFNYSYLIDIVKSNIGILMSLLDSLYLLLKSNINILFTIVQLLISILFQGGFAILNFFISLIVYLTALFYLLSTSDKRYKPLQWMNEIAIIKGQRGQLLSKAIEESIRSVFVASLKMGAFYGLYTWIIHNLFSLNIFYIPSILAALFGFLPILGTYWSALPGVLELWLVRRQPFYALLFFICNIFPTYVVDMAIYSDIKGGHPYLTGLAIAGGLYCLGLEGALIGPIVLCLFIVIIKMNKEFLAGNSFQNIIK